MRVTDMDWTELKVRMSHTLTMPDTSAVTTCWEPGIAHTARRLERWPFNGPIIEPLLGVESSVSVEGKHRDRYRHLRANRSI